MAKYILNTHMFVSRSGFHREGSIIEMEPCEELRYWLSERMISPYTEPVPEHVEVEKIEEVTLGGSVPLDIPDPRSEAKLEPKQVTKKPIWKK